MRGFSPAKETEIKPRINKVTRPPKNVFFIYPPFMGFASRINSRLMDRSVIIGYIIYHPVFTFVN
jgi:hypothetical protein